MRILHLDSGRQMRGGQWQALYLMQGLRAAGHTQMLLARAGAPLLARAAAEGFTAKALTPYGIFRWSGGQDVVHAHDARTHTLAALWARAPLVVARRVAFPLQTGILSRWKYKRAAKFIAISHVVRQALVQGGVNSRRIAVVHDGVLLPEKPGFDAHGPAVSLGLDDPLKGGPLLHEAARRAGVEMKSSTDLAKDLAGARLFLYVTRQEGLGSAALVAMAAGIPVVASKVGGLPEIVHDGVNGLLVENNPEAIAAAVKRLWDDPPLAAGMGRRGRHLVEQGFTVEHMVRGTLEVYEGITACGKP